MFRKFFILFILVALIALPIFAAADIQGEQVTNGSFDAALADPWLFWTNAAAKQTLENGEVKISISDEGAEYWSVQFNFDKTQVVKGQTYVLKFDARSTVPRDIQVMIEHKGDPYTKYFGPETVSLTDKMTTYTYEFTQKGPKDSGTHLVLALGKVNQKVGQAHDVFIDNVSFSTK